MGRLGNNMFQIAACIGYAKKYGVEWGIPKGYIEPGFQVYQVDLFMPDLPSSDDVHFKRYDEEFFGYTEIPFYPEGIRLVGYFQSAKYFDHCKEEIQKIFNVPKFPSFSEYCGIHARRGDYVTYDTHFPPVNIDYFRVAIPMMLDKGITKFIVCSDGMEWCEDVLPANFPGVHFEFSKGLHEWQDMGLMASCAGNIIANSSFSWWSAYLNPNPNKIVISPHGTSWFGEAGGPVREAASRGIEPCLDLIPESWHKIKFR